MPIELFAPDLFFGSVIQHIKAKSIQHRNTDVYSHWPIVSRMSETRYSQVRGVNQAALKVETTGYRFRPYRIQALKMIGYISVPCPDSHWVFWLYSWTSSLWILLEEAVLMNQGFKI